ncbi:amidohydrolase family protein [uncultured Thalassolituus sp.]|uniref:amidohydrolase family protein n=1 Tax=uncultured Thalassolituus sp. TaxID=285273 RepID=UPI00261222EF|nr:amidohydrolase family protein [uncultured Thalassolituus sp.]
MTNNISRRELMTTGAKVAAGAGLIAQGLGQTAQAGLLGHKKIDVHHHAVPAPYIEALASIGITESGGVAFPEWTPEDSLKVMNLTGIDTAVLSLSSPGTYFGDATFASGLAHTVNEFLHDTVQAHPFRFGFFATLPMPLVDESCAVLRHAFDSLDADGVCLLANTNGVFLGDPALDPIMEELNARGATVLIHPNSHPLQGQLGLEAPVFAVEFVLDTTRAVTNMLWNGTFEKYPDIKWILSHAGGTVPYIAWRVSLLSFQYPEFREKAPRGVPHYLRRLYFDTALSPSASTLFPLIEQFGADQVVLGTDYPFAPEALVPVEMATLAANVANQGFPDFTPSVLKKIHGNGYRLFPRLDALHN